MTDGFKRPFRGVFPVMPTIFDATGALDLPGQLRCADFMIDAGADGVCILANFSEQFALSDDERAILTERIIVHVAGRVPVIVTTTHFSADICAARSRRAQELGAAMVMVLPPHHGATVRIGPQGIIEFFQTVSDAIDIPIIVQDAPVSGTALPAPFLVQLATSIEHVCYFKIEVPQAAMKLDEMISIGGAAIEGPWDGEEAITLLADLDAGATGAMTGGGYPDLIGPIVHAYLGGNRAGAIAGYNQTLPLINYENRQCGLLAAKALMHEGGIIGCDRPRAPLPMLTSKIRAGLIEVARSLDPLVLRWAR